MMSDSGWGVSLRMRVVLEPCELSHDPDERDRCSTDEVRKGFIDMSMMFAGERGCSLVSIIMTIADHNGRLNPLQESDTLRDPSKPRSCKQVNCQSILTQLDKKSGH